MPTDEQTLSTEFDRHRAQLLAVAYRLTGGLDDAEDAVQETWLRLARLSPAERAEIRELGAWLTTVVGRICLDRMRSAAARRERYVGPWLPEPIVTSLERSDVPDPLDSVVHRDELRMAAVRLLHDLSPDQRFAVVLHDGFGVPFAEIADALGCEVATARQHASRARHALAAGDAPPRATPTEQRQLLDDFLTAVSTGDLERLTTLLHPTAVLLGDSDGRARTAARPILGPDKIGRFTLGLVRKYGDDLLGGARFVLVNGDLGLAVPGGPVDADGRQRVAPRVLAFAMRAGTVTTVFDVVNPEKLTRTHR